MEQIDTDSEPVERSESTWLFAQPKADAQATTPTLLTDSAVLAHQKVGWTAPCHVLEEPQKAAVSYRYAAQQENVSPQMQTPAPLKRLDLERSTPPTSSYQNTQVQNAARRKAAAEWVLAITTITLPASSDNAFRRALRDGEILCKVINNIRPGILPKVHAILSLSLSVMHSASQTCTQIRHIAGARGRGH